jgi:integrase
MPTRQRNFLTPLKIASIKADGWYKDGGNLFLRVSNDNTRRRWIFRFRRGAKVTEIGLGGEGTFALAEVREKRDQLLKQVERGLDPLAERRRNEHLQAQRKSFGEVAAAVMARQAKSGRSESSLYSWRRSFEVHCAKISKLNVEDIGTGDVLVVVLPLIDSAGYPTARRTLARIADTLAFAIAHQWRSGANVAEWRNIKAVIPERPNGKRGRPMLQWPEAPAFIQALRESEAVSARCLEFIMLTAVRLSEARGAQWSEIDFKAALWTVPANRMKRRVEFKVPLSDRAVALLEQLRTHRPTGGRVFSVGRCAVWDICKRVSGTASVHGMRATFRSWAADHGIDDGLAEMCLSHGPGDATKSAYNRAEMVERRRVVMQAWADFLDGKHSADVVPLKRA